MTGERIRIRDGSVEWRAVDGEIVALDTRAAEYFAITGSGALLWPSLVEGTTVAELVSVLVERYRISEQTADTDVGAFLDALAGRELLNRAT